jgi:hypothetical protein
MSLGVYMLQMSGWRPETSDPLHHFVDPRHTTRWKSFKAFRDGYANGAAMNPNENA